MAYTPQVPVTLLDRLLLQYQQEDGYNTKGPVHLYLGISPKEYADWQANPADLPKLYQRLQQVTPMLESCLVLADELVHQRAKGRTPEADDKYTQGQLVNAAKAYMAYYYWQVSNARPDDAKGAALQSWPFKPETFHPSPEPLVNLRKAGAFVLSEVGRVLRKEYKAGNGVGQLLRYLSVSPAKGWALTSGGGNGDLQGTFTESDDQAGKHSQQDLTNAAAGQLADYLATQNGLADTGEDYQTKQASAEDPRFYPQSAKLVNTVTGESLDIQLSGRIQGLRPNGSARPRSRNEGMEKVREAIYRGEQPVTVRLGDTPDPARLPEPNDPLRIGANVAGTVWQCLKPSQTISPADWSNAWLQRLGEKAAPLLLPFGETGKITEEAQQVTKDLLAIGVRGNMRYARNPERTDQGRALLAEIYAYCRDRGITPRRWEDEVADVLVQVAPRA